MTGTNTFRPVPTRVVSSMVVAIMLVGSLVACGRSNASSEEGKTGGPAALPRGVVELSQDAQRGGELATANSERVTLPTTIELTGTVAPDDVRVSHIRPLARGVIERVSVRLGDRVTAGQSLAEYDNIELGELIGDYLTARATLRQAQTDREVKQTGLARAEALIKLEAIAQQTLDQRRAEFQNSEAAVASEQARVAKVEEQLHRFGMSDADLAALGPQDAQGGHRVASHSILRAPFAGVVTKYDVAPGELVGPQSDLFTIANLSTVWVLADLYEKDLAKVQTSTMATVRVEAYPNRVFAGELTYVSDLIDPTTRTAKVRCVVPNPDGLLKLDMFAKISVPTNDRHEALVVPSAAVQQIDNQPVVFVRMSPTRFERRDIRTGASADGRVEVSGALKAGEPVVTTGSFYLKTALLSERVAGDE